MVKWLCFTEASVVQQMSRENVDEFRKELSTAVHEALLDTKNGGQRRFVRRMIQFADRWGLSVKCGLSGDLFDGESYDAVFSRRYASSRTPVDRLWDYVRETFIYSNDAGGGMESVLVALQMWMISKALPTVTPPCILP